MVNTVPRSVLQRHHVSETLQRAPCFKAPESWQGPSPMAGRDLVVGTPKEGIWVLNCFLGGCLSEVKGGYLFGFFFGIFQEFSKIQKVFQKIPKKWLAHTHMQGTTPSLRQADPELWVSTGVAGVGYGVFDPGSGGVNDRAFAIEDFPPNIAAPLIQPVFPTSHMDLPTPFFSPTGGLEGTPFFLRRTAFTDRPQGPPTANRHQLPTATNCLLPPTATDRQPPCVPTLEPCAALQ